MRQFNRTIRAQHQRIVSELPQPLPFTVSFLTTHSGPHNTHIRIHAVHCHLITETCTILCRILCRMRQIAFSLLIKKVLRLQQVLRLRLCRLRTHPFSVCMHTNFQHFTKAFATTWLKDAVPQIPRSVVLRFFIWGEEVPSSSSSISSRHVHQSMDALCSSQTVLAKRNIGPIISSQTRRP